MTWHDALELAVENAYSALNLALIEPARRMGLQLEQMRAFDFSCIGAEAAEVYKNTKLRLRFLPLAHRVSLDGTGQYNRPVVRSFGGISETQSQVLTGVYKELGVDLEALDAEQAGVLQNAYLQTCLPSREGRLRLRTWFPYSVAELEFDDDEEDRVQYARRLVLLKPLRRSATDHLFEEVLGAAPWCSRYVLTRDEAYIEYPDQQRRGIFNAAGTNPMGRVPAIGTRRVKPASGASWAPKPSEDVFSCSVGQILAVSDCEEIIRTQGPDKPVLTGPGAADVAKKAQAAPNNWMVIDAPATEAKAVHFSPNIEAFLRVPETYVYLLSQYRYLRPEAYAASIVTGSARRSEAEGYVDNLHRHEQRINVLEQDRAALIVDAFNAVRAGALRLDRPDVTCLYRYTENADNVLQRQQALAIAFQHGHADIVRDVMLEEKCSEQEAEHLIVARLERFDRLVRSRHAAAVASTPGLDKITRDGVTNDANARLA